ncbi:minor capsid protein [Anaeromassilibacillus senegalensis]|uniref:minor capsid protein n=1 Tax=Anaeromassilibacillus senegalensis TaxID=1673717 RepID=UPI0006806FCD|nr:minor capsid protein [Anaeromassilibacillus senegalensis]
MSSRTKIYPRIETGAILRSRGLGASTSARRHLAVTVARLSDKYVPMQSSTLKNTRQIDSEGRAILYNQPYANTQYEGKSRSGAPLNYHGAPMRGPHWDKRMMADRGDEVIDDLAKFVGGKRK